MNWTMNSKRTIGGAAVVLMALGCGGTEADWEGEEGVTSAELFVSSKCFPAGKHRWTTQSAPLRSRPTANSARLRTMPKGLRVRLADRNGDGRVCRAKESRGQPNWFISVRRGDGRKGWMNIEALRASPPTQNPAPGHHVTTPFGTRGSWAAGYHTGDDYAAAKGSRVVATRPGKVKTVSRSAYGSSYGLHVVVETDGVRHLYAHLSRASVSVGDSVAQGTLIGRVGTSGNSTGYHLHYEERVSPYGYYNHRRPRFNR